MCKFLLNPLFPTVASLGLGMVLVLLSTPLGYLLAVDSMAVLTLGIRLAFYGPLLTVVWVILVLLLVLITGTLR